MKRIALSLFALVFSFGCMASQVTTTVSRQAAANFWNTHRSIDVKAVTPEQLQLVPVSELPMLHIWAVDQTGFVIMSASDQVNPILAYSFDSPASRQPNSEVMFWLRQYNAQIAAAEANGYQNAEAAAQWNNLLTSTVPATPVSIVEVPALMSSRWDQGEPYNRLCPLDSVYNSRTVVGCVATAMAQIMRYWRHPSSGTGRHSYVHHSWRTEMSYGELEADFGNTTYIWEYMPDYLEQYIAQPTAVHEVSTISYHCGVAVNMMYGPSALGGSGAYSSCGDWTSACAESAFRDYFKYNPDLHYMQRNVVVWRDSLAYDTATAEYVNVYYRADSALISDSVWCTMIDSNLAHNAPMYYSGSDSTSGHAFVLDGSDSQGRYHFNWGWSGYYDGFYGINNVAPGSGGIGGNATYTFNSDQGAIFDILPLPEHFDSVAIDDTVCRGSSKYYFHNYEFPVADTVYTAVYLDTVYTINLHVISKRRLYVNANGGTGSAYDIPFCQTDGITLPSCSFTRDNHIFIGWGFDRRNNDTIYQPGTHLMLRVSKTIYAIWQDTTVQDTTSVGITVVDGGVLSISPNPTRDHIDISLESAEDATVCIIDQMGRVVIKRKAIAGKAEIALDKLAAGTYIVQVITSDAEYKSRIIKL